MKHFFSELWHRLKSSTPPFFKKIQAIGGGMTSAGTGMIIGGELRAGGIMAGVGLAISFVASLACTDASDEVKNKVTIKNQNKDVTN